jgi:hypothetical protein
LSVVGLSVAIIFPFLIVAFTVNPVRDRVQGTRRHLKYKTMGIESRPKKIWITSKYMTYYLWVPVYYVLGYLLKVIWVLAEFAFDFVDLVIDLAKEKISRALKKFKRKKKANPDEESQELNGGGDSSGNEKAVNMETKDKTLI